MESIQPTPLFVHFIRCRELLTLTAARLAVLERLSVMVLTAPISQQISLGERAERTAGRLGTQTHSAVVVGLVTILVVNGEFVVPDQNVMEKIRGGLMDFSLILVLCR